MNKLLTIVSGALAATALATSVHAKLDISAPMDMDFEGALSEGIVLETSEDVDSDYRLVHNQEHLDKAYTRDADQGENRVSAVSEESNFGPLGDPLR